MKKALDILFKQTNGDADYVSIDCCLQAMKAYAKEVAEKVRKDCADRLDNKIFDDGFGGLDKNLELCILQTPITLD